MRPTIGLILLRVEAYEVKQILKRTGNISNIATDRITPERSPKLAGRRLNDETQDVKPSLDSGLGDGHGRPPKEKT